MIRKEEKQRLKEEKKPQLMQIILSQRVEEFTWPK